MVHNICTVETKSRHINLVIQHRCLFLCISNADRIGKSEVELAQLVINGINRLVMMEKRLEKKQGISDLMPTGLA